VSPGRGDIPALSSTVAARNRFEQLYSSPGDREREKKQKKTIYNKHRDPAEMQRRVDVCVSLDHFGFVFSNFVLLGFVFSVPRQEIGWEERLRNDLFCVEWDAKPYSVQFSC